MKVIGLTGGIGSGKSTVARFLAELGAVAVDADNVGHEALKANGEVRKQIIKEFGKGVVTASGDIDRVKLGELVFGNDEARMNLNSIMHPVMYNMVEAQLEEYRLRGLGPGVLLSCPGRRLLRLALEPRR